MSAATFAIIAIIVLGAGALFRKQILLETYFEESVQGLDVGSPIKFRGVQIGQVEEIILAEKEYLTDRQYVLVRASLFPDVAPLRTEEEAGMDLKEAIQKGLRIRLAFLGVTGTAYLESDYLDPERNVPLQIDWEPQNPYVPSAPSTIKRFSESADRILRNLEQINIQEITEGLEKTLQIVSNALEDTNMKKIGEQAGQLFAEVRETNRRIGQLLEGDKIASILTDASVTVATTRRIVERSEKPLNETLKTLPEASASLHNFAKNLDALSGDLPQTLARLQRILRRLDNLISNEEQDVEVAIENIRLISENLKELTDNARKYPSQLLFSEPPPRAEPGNRR